MTTEQRGHPGGRRQQRLVGWLLTLGLVLAGVAGGANLPAGVLADGTAVVGCTAGGGDPTELIDAINAVQLDGGGTIVLAAGCVYTLIDGQFPGSIGDNGLPIITTDLRIEGTGATIERSGEEDTSAFRIFEVANEGSLTLDGVTLANGDAGDAYGGAILTVFGTVTVTNSTLRGNRAGLGGGIANGSGTIAVTNSILTGNIATGGLVTAGLINDLPAAAGGGIFNGSGAVTVTNSIVHDNKAIGRTTGDLIIGTGAGIANAEGTLTVSGSILSNNLATGAVLENAGLRFAGGGGGIAAFQGETTVTHSILDGNTAIDGGGIAAAFGTVTVSSSTLSGNSASMTGGGMANLSGSIAVDKSTLSGNTAKWGAGIYTELGPVTATNSTLSGNSATEEGEGGGIYTNYGSVAVTYSTLARNEAPAGSGISVGAADGEATLSASVLANGSADNCLSAVEGRIVDAGYNLATDSSCGVQADAVVSLADLALGELTANGGPTHTILLGRGSVAIDRIPHVACAIATDQRGVERPQGQGCEVGAVEVDPQPQTIAFDALADRTYGDEPFTLTASASSGLPVSFQSTTEEVCTVAGNMVTLVAVGECAITASQAGDAYYAPAAAVTQRFTVHPLAASVTLDLGTGTPLFVDRKTRRATLNPLATVTVARGDVVTVLPVTYALTPAGGGQPILICDDEEGTSRTDSSLHSTCTFTGILAGRYTLTASVGGNYSGSARATVMVVDPVAGFVTGGGLVQGGMLSFSASYYGTQLNGAISYQRTSGGRVALSTTKLTSFVRVGATVYVEGEASLNGVSGHRVLVTAIDNPGLQRDQVRLEVWDRAGNLIESAGFDLTALLSGQVYLGPGL